MDLKLISRVLAVCIGCCLLTHGEAIKFSQHSLKYRLAAKASACQPYSVPAPLRCEYVKKECSDLSGLVDFLDIHFCKFEQWPWASLLIQLCWVVLMFTVLTVACDRFFCPSIERISEFLKLSPAVAGATLLSFGNGVADIFTQLSMADGAGVELALTEPIGSGICATTVVVALVVLATPMKEVYVARSLFLKDCLFYMAGVLGVLMLLIWGSVAQWQLALLLLLYVAYVATTVALCGGDAPMKAEPESHEVPIHRSTSHLDKACKLFMARQRQRRIRRERYGCLGWALDCSCMAWIFDYCWSGSYGSSDLDMVLNGDESGSWSRELLLCWDDDIGDGGGWFDSAGCPSTNPGPDVNCVRTCSDAAVLQNVQACNRHSSYESEDAAYPHAPCNISSDVEDSPGSEPRSLIMPASVAIMGEGEAAPLPELCSSSSCNTILDSATVRTAPAAAQTRLVWNRSASSSSILGSRSRKQNEGLLPYSPSAAAASWGNTSSMGTASIRRKVTWDIADSQEGLLLPPAISDCTAEAATVSNCSEGPASAVPICSEGPTTAVPACSQVLVSVPVRSEGGTSSLPTCSERPSASFKKFWRHYSHPIFHAWRHAHPIFHACAPTLRSEAVAECAVNSATRVSDLRSVEVDPPKEVMCGVLNPSPVLRGSGASVAASGERIEKGASGMPKGVSLWLLVVWMWRAPVQAAISLTLPLLSNRKGSGVRYPSRFYASMMPLVLPLLVAVHWFHFAPFEASWLEDRQLQVCTACCLILSILMLVTYPTDGFLTGWPLGACTVLVFFGSMVWMDVAADEVVVITMAFGIIFNINSSLLAVTLVSWGSSTSDIAANLAMAREGFPTMALTACFGSPLFVLLGGVGCTLLYVGGTDDYDGPVILPQTASIRVLYSCCLACSFTWAVAVPLCFRYKLNIWTVALGFLLYAAFVAIYLFSSIC
ncbi:hypothetical protein CEUSTIGMA_g12398.t1 [Chlamydomonas eustigma]|uniref:Sodium/calcium exchanger membrane region domain-containing protein n=1 Tax=Chlamydomonas eustigma TaxID=1157962 RepID=A0A250XPH8_9CHLO|nr:hypothetical protein CEUSTIGMA_g12398.t1 [Chlamydomonas eustigma]|eukprot:GAX84977.1 hypothetical protein CEUSTIGMA_g12398.t1 [Chlamydomonas eustigma]